MDYTSQNDSTKVTLESFKNMKSSSSVEYSFFYQKSLTGKWDLSINGNFASVNYKGDIDGINFNRTGISYFGNISNTILVGKNMKFEASGRYLGPFISGIVQVKPRWIASLAVKMSLFKEKLDFTFGMDDVFYSLKLRSTSNFENQNWSYLQINDTRRFRVALNYRFGKIKIDERNVNTSNEEEKQRFNH